MWTEIIISREDLARLVGQAFPLTIRLGDADSDNSLELSELGAVRLVPELGLRVECKARVRWPVLGIDLPVSMKALTLLIVPSVAAGTNGDILVFRASIEHADFSALPQMLDERVTAMINEKLAGKDAELRADLFNALTLTAALPPLLEELAAFAMRPRWIKVRVTDEAVVYAASFNTALVRHGHPVPADIALPSSDTALASQPPPPRESTFRLRATSGQRILRQLASAGIFGLGAGAAFFALRLVARER